MAKYIKALKCPQCGSVKKQEYKEDHYICSNCGTEYFLDNDDIHVNIKHTYNSEKAPSLRDKNRKNIIYFLIFIVGITLFSTLITSLWEGKNVVNTIHANKNYSERIESYLAYPGKHPEDIVVMFKVERRNSSAEEKREQYFIRFYDPIHQKVLNEEEMVDWKDGYHLRSRKFSDGKWYLLPDKSSRLYQLNEERNALEEITDEIFGAVPELSSGIATLDFVNKENGDGFRLMTNDGREFYYYPIVQKLYKDFKELRESYLGLKSLKDDAVESIRFIFTEKSHEYPDEKRQLIKYRYKNNLGYPIQLPYSNQTKWQKVYNFNNRLGTTSYDKKLFQNSRISEFRDLTPDRLYFSAEIMYQDKDNLYIKGLPNANPEGKMYIQKIDTETGAVLWTYTPEEDVYAYGTDFFVYANGVVFDYYNYGAPGRINKIVVLDNAGKEISTMDQDKLFN
ncbi:hypothetical protein ORI89_06615 [Sphingobacterium sp. UT-1RO-CII-1]|uniref:hypothetical protein n=1 Tax=Sphingobacterium sp. UT-1RO-CII-1 TaxID=2995225 RepID=UPI00227CD9DA|nr:hypothetical protein [Sphingobacterium sp. UT-1RO-CII-1]MCY4779315.1 hypothetical protein [Sphingobacterium sp. UT-1RO-CII-1]